MLQIGDDNICATVGDGFVRAVVLVGRWAVVVVVGGGISAWFTIIRAIYERSNFRFIDARRIVRDNDGLAVLDRILLATSWYRRRCH